MDKTVLIVYSPETGRMLHSPVSEYFREEIRRTYGHEFESAATRHMIRRLTEMDEGEPVTELEEAMEDFVKPVLGYAQGMERVGISKEEAVRFSIDTWNQIMGKKACGE